MATASVELRPARQELIRQARQRSDELFAMLDPGLLFVRPIPLRHRLVFYLGHLEAFDFNQLVKADAGPRGSVHPAFEKLFDRGIDPAAGEEPQDTARDWPARGEIEAFRKRTRLAVDDAVAADRAGDDLVHIMGEHRLMHVETLAYMLHELPGSAKKQPRGGVTRRRLGQLDRSPVEVPEGEALVGRERGTGWGWDNEFEAHCVPVEAFRIDRHKVTNGEYLRYVLATGALVPHFWSRQGSTWLWRGMFESVPLPLDAPVFVTHDEAAAYAQWRGQRLPTEAEFHRAAYGTPEGGERPYPWGEEPPTAARAHADFHGFDPVDVGATPEGDSAFGVAQMVGNGWEWTATPFGPFPGFAAHQTYPEYSADFFDSRHYVLKGGSPRTAAALLRRSFRNWFRPDYPYVYAAFRCVES